MPSLRDHHSNEFTKMINMGHPGTGKTGGLASLVKAGYKVRVLDYDNNLDSLKAFVGKECPEKLDNVQFRTLRDLRVVSPAGEQVILGTPRAFVDGIKLLQHWRGDEVDLGNPAEWGPECVLVLDSLTLFSTAAFDHREYLTVTTSRGKFDNRAIYYDTQSVIKKTIANLMGEAFRTNVIINAHISYIDLDDGTKKGFPTTVGSALGPIIGAYTSSLFQFEVRGGQYVINTKPTGMVDLKNPRPFAMKDTYPVSTGLADIFNVLRASPDGKDQPTKPTEVPSLSSRRTMRPV